MRHFGLNATLAVAILFLGGVAHGDDASTPTTGPSSTGPITAEECAPVYGPSTPEDRTNVQASVDKWTAAPVADRDGGEVALDSLVPYRAFALLEEQVQRADLSADARSWLKSIVERDRPRIRARLLLSKREHEYFKWNKRSAVAAYSEAGHKDPKWDNAAEQGILFCADKLDTSDRAKPLLDEAIQEGCDDPLVRFYDTGMNHHFGVPDEWHEKMCDATRAILKSKYPASRKVITALYTLRDSRGIWQNVVTDTPEKQKQYTDDTYPFMMGLLDNWPKMVAEEGVPKTVIGDLGMQLMDIDYWQGQDRKKYIFDKIEPTLVKALPDSAVSLICKGAFYIRFAWDGRGGGYANQVTPEGWKKFQDRLAIAHKALEEAWKKDPTWPQIADHMLEVGIGEGFSQEEMETWFGRAMQLNPDDTMACEHKMQYLEPQWHGSAEAMVAFGRECVDQRNWVGGIPWKLRDAHRFLAAFSDKPDAYWQGAGVWEDLQLLYLPLLKGLPDNVVDRSDYCYWACKTEHWDVAAQQFEILGDRIYVPSFDSKEQMEQMKVDAKEKGGK